MFRQILLSGNTTQMGRIYSLIQSKRSVGHLCASKLMKSNEDLTFRRSTVLKTMNLHRMNYCTSEDDKRKKKKKKFMSFPRAVDHVGRLDMRVGRIIEVEKSSYADTFYLLKVDIGDEIRPIVTVCAKHITMDQLLNQNAVALCNIKPAELRGHTTYGMILCAESESGDVKELLTPPSNAQPGELIYCENFERDPVPIPRKKMRLFDPLASDFRTNNKLIACYQSSYLFVPEKGNIVVKSLKNANISKYG